MALKNKCPYCFYKLAKDGFCARVCKMGALKRKQHELEEKEKGTSDSEVTSDK